MLIKMKRSQHTVLGTLRAGVAYNIDANQHPKLLDRLLAGKKFAMKTTKAQLKKDAEALAVREKAQLANAEDGAVEPELIRLESARILADIAVKDAQTALDTTKPKSPECKAAAKTLKEAMAALAKAK